MKTIVAGSRHCADVGVVLTAMNESGYDITEVVSGCAPGVDTLGEEIALALSIPVKRFPADWERYGRAAGPIRNRQMAEYAEALVAVLYPGSRGTLNMIKQAKERGLTVFVYEPQRREEP